MAGRCIMKKITLLTGMFLACIFLAACGAEEEGPAWQGIPPGMEDLSAVTDRTEFYDITVEQEEIDAGLWEKNPRDENVFNALLWGRTVYLPLGAQFFKGEPVQLWAEASPGGSNVYLYREDGSGGLLLQDIPNTYPASRTPVYRWYLGQEGEFYCFRTEYPYENGEYGYQSTLVKIQSSGEVLYETKLEQGVCIDDFCQLEDGRIYLLLYNGTEETKFLAEMDAASGELVPESRIELPYKYEVYLGAAGNSPAVTGYVGGYEDFSYKVMKVDTADKSLSPVLYFTGTSYRWHSNLQLQDFRVREDGQIELVWTDFDGTDCLLERLRMEKVEKVPIVVRGLFYNDAWIGERAARFNRENGTYHVILEDCGLGNDEEDFARLTSVQIGAGKGPDILCGVLVRDYLDIAGMLEKGALEALNPYMEASGIREEDYFPLTFASWRQGEQIYSVDYKMGVADYEIDEEVLGSREIPDIETLADALLSWEGDSVYYKGSDSVQVLKMFLQGTESLWGMVDWESGSCEFNTPLFAKLLEAAGRYGDDGRRNTASGIVSSRSFANVIQFHGQAEQEAEGKVTCGGLFDDGCHPIAFSSFTCGINANSLHKEGAWEFIRFLLDEETQSMPTGVSDAYTAPTHRKAFEMWMQERVINVLVRESYVNGILTRPAYYGADVSEEKQEEYRRAIEDARTLPWRTASILSIILEEAESYFDGSKSAEEVSNVVNNRVQLYLDEHR